MPRKSDQRNLAIGPMGTERTAGAGSVRRLLRYSHIFASAVHEILESKLLRQASRAPLSVSQFHLLALISFNGRHQVGEVADFLGVSAPAATKNIDKLERLGLVVRTPSKGDRRATLLSVSPKGRRLVRRYEELKTARLSPVFENFAPREVEQFSELLRRFSVSLFDTDSAREGFCLRCAAYIAEDCPIGHVHGGCPYQRLRHAHQHEDARDEPF